MTISKATIMPINFWLMLFFGRSKPKTNKKERKMKPTNRPVISREYKLILNADRFQNRGQGIETFWNLVESLLTKQGGQIRQRQDEEKIRRTWYLDTPGLDFRRRDFVLRVREETEEVNKKFKMTLKYRTSDRYVSASQNLVTTGKGKYKFEEDILPPFTSKFSHSTSVKQVETPRLFNIEQVVGLFPGIAALNLANDTPIEQVNGFEAHEVAHWVGQFKFEQKPIVKACLSFWYLMGDKDGLPLIVEFSFDYDAPEETKDDQTKLEQYPLSTVAGTYRFFRTLQQQTDWINFNATTKTAYAYEALQVHYNLDQKGLLIHQ
jgi:hypothetical protein